MARLAPPSVPCGSCPYRCDVPSGLWMQDEYDKLPKYDGDIGAQLMKGAGGLFMCHQRDGHLCGGWLACHGPTELLAMRMAAFHDEVSPDAFDYETSVPVFGSGAEARRHGMRDIAEPGSKARKMVAGLMKKLEGC